MDEDATGPSEGDRRPHSLLGKATMGIIITAKKRGVGSNLALKEFVDPLGVSVFLECDEPESIFCRGFATFEHEDGYVGAHKDAMAAGWLERQSPRGRLWICPACSGK